MTPASVTLSVVVVAHDHDRELPRTLRTLRAPYQRRREPADHEVIVVDNGSARPVASTLPTDLRSSVRVHRIDDAPPSPAQAANVGVALARGELIGLVIDGARMASPGLLATAMTAARLSPRAVITAPAWHLGPDVQARSTAKGYDQAAEDELLAACGWERDGYALFAVSTPAASSARGLFGPMGESSSLFMQRELWNELGGLDERFVLPGGGLVNHDLYRRACGLPGIELVVLLGEGTFHQVHGGAATSGRVARDDMRGEYEAIRGAPYTPPSNVPTYLGTATAPYLPYVARSVALAEART
jgi:hypothetical protein